ncbi:hypothetical protein [Actinocatenispora sera]|uniref:hypothetical protein n=1 Tax=Actinocatenispora sera TaxID=390989 RepID=UPI000558BFB7|nr:hypothetical protein [Actinocatenispora sera]
MTRAQACWPDRVEVFAADEVRVEHEAEARRMWSLVGQRTKLYVDRQREAMSFFEALNLKTGKVGIEWIDGQQNTAQTIGVLARVQRTIREETRDHVGQRRLAHVEGAEGMLRRREPVSPTSP